MKFTSIIISSLLAAVAIFALFSFAITFANYNGTLNLNSDSSFNRAFGNISTQLNESTRLANERQNALIEESNNPILTQLGFVFRSILDGGTVFMNFGVGIINIMGIFLQKTLFVNPIVFSSIVVILLIGLIFGAWRLYRAGE